MKPQVDWKLFLAEMALYAVLVLTYFGLVLHYLSSWLKDIFDHNRITFAIVALLLMIGQSVGLEVICSLLVRFIRRKGK